MRQDPRTPLAAGMPEVHLEDHASSFLADVAQSLIVLEDSPTVPGRLLQDGSEIQRVIAELCGRQRAQFGWTAEALDLLERFLEWAEQMSRRSLRYARVM